MIELNDLKRQINMEMMFDLLNFFGANPTWKNDETIISDTICHNMPGEGSHKLYTYWNDDMAILHCYTDCGSFDVIQLVIKVFELKGYHYEIYEAITFLQNFFSLDFGDEEAIEEKERTEDWKYFRSIEEKKEKGKKEKKKVELKYYSNDILRFFPRPRLLNWEREGITKEVCDRCGICYNPVSQGIIIPHYDADNRLIGIRERTLVKEKEEFGKYRPAIIGDKMWNHPLSFSLYNLNHSKENIQKIKKAIVFESEKSCLKYRSFFGEENDISCAVCGSNLTKYQFWLMRSYGAEEIIIGFDRQYKEIGDEEYHKWVKKLKDIAKKYSSYCNITFLFDTKNLLDYKDAPIDKGAEIFLQLFKERLDKDGKTR